MVLKSHHSVNGIILLLIVLAGISCNKESQEKVPNVYVNFTVDINSGQYTDLQLIGGWIYVTGGYRGIILYRGSQDEITALDRTSTYKPVTLGTQVIVESNNLMAADTAHGMRYLLTDGSVVEGSVSVPLKKYRTTFTGSILNVYN
jgi:hypothetical protein